MNAYAKMFYPIINYYILLCKKPESLISFTVNSSSNSTTGYVLDNFLTSSAPSMTSTLNNTATRTQSNFPKIILRLVEHEHTSANAQVKGLLTDFKYSENIYALKYILEHKEILYQHKC